MSGDVDRLVTSIAPTSGDNKLTKGTFNFMYAVGRGGYGQVWRAKTHQGFDDEASEFAVKEMKKGRILLKKSL